MIQQVRLKISDALKNERLTITVQGLTGSSKALFLSQIPRVVAIFTSSQEEAERMHEDLILFKALFSEPYSLRPVIFPSIDFPSEPSNRDSRVLGERIMILSRLADGERFAVISSSETLTDHLPSRDTLRDKRKTLKIGEPIERDSFGKIIMTLGYKAVSAVREVGEFSIRGGIFDIYSPYHENPLRIDLFGDEIESIREFDKDTQRSIRNLSEAIILPAREDSGIFKEKERLFDYLPEDCLYVFDEPDRFYEKIKEIEPLLKDHQVLNLETLIISKKGKVLTFETESIESQILKGFPSLIERLKEWKGLYRVLFISHTSGKAERLRDLLIEHGIDCQIQLTAQGLQLTAHQLPVIIIVGRLSKGFLFPAIGLILITEEEIFGEKIRRKVHKRSRLEHFLSSIEELHEGDYVVHVDYGIGIFSGVKRIKVDGYESDLFLINYAGEDRLYLPLDRMDRIQRYIGLEGRPPELNRLGGISWQKSKARIKKEMGKMAKDLLKLYAKRKVLEGYPFSPDSYLHREFDSSFEYEETPDQLRTIEEVKRDMEMPRPMERLICGDVGYGKTEMAIRAAFKAIYDNKQVVVLTPTTILAEQHYQTFSERFSAFPVRIEVLSRFKIAKEQKGIIKDISQGLIDIVIGTHRLLQDDVRFKDLGLLIIDEEQRFGVSHKERIKKLKETVDVLTLTATPIPRTLEMALTGVKDLSLIDTPPEDRLSVRTIITKFDKKMIREAIIREISHGGQVFFVHNRVETMGRMVEYLKRIVPEARISMAHGQMRERELEKVMVSLLKKDIDLLVTSAIIESGLDIPSANTILINMADKFGLADLYQLRGRVGRSNRRAYAYFLIPGEKILTEDARKRLRAVQELSELGAGFKIAMRDLEIRGAGSLLGPEQSGHIAALGFDLYVQMLEGAVREIKGEEVLPLEDPAMDMKCPAFIPDDYIPDINQRLSVYRKIASVRTEEEIYDLRDELMDRFGEIPQATLRLFDIIDLKNLARALRIKRIERIREGINIVFDERAELEAEKVLRSSGDCLIRFIPESTIQLAIRDTKWDSLYRETKNFLQELLRCVTSESQDCVS